MTKTSIHRKKILKILKDMKPPEDRGQYMVFGNGGVVEFGETGEKTKGASIERVKVYD